MLLSFVIITFLSACTSEEEVEEPEVIREGPPPLENPQYRSRNIYRQHAGRQIFPQKQHSNCIQ